MTTPVFVSSLKDLLKNQLKLPVIHKAMRDGKYFIGLGLRKFSLKITTMNGEEIREFLEDGSTIDKHSPLDAVFGVDVADSEEGCSSPGCDVPVTDYDVPVTEDVTGKTRMVTNVTDFDEKKVSGKNDAEHKTKIFSENEKSLKKYVTPVTPVTTRAKPVTEPVTSPVGMSQSPSQSVTCSSCERMKCNDSGIPYCLLPNGVFVELRKVKECPKKVKQEATA